MKFLRKKGVIFGIFVSLFFNQIKPVTSNTSITSSKEIRSVIVGHLYPIYDESNIKEKLFNKILNLLWKINRL